MSAIKFDADSPRAKKLHQEVFNKVREIWDPTKTDEAVSSVAQYTVALAARGTDRKKLQASLASIVGNDASSLLLDWLVRHVQQHKKELMSSQAPVKAPKAKPAPQPAAVVKAATKVELAKKEQPTSKPDVKQASQQVPSQQQQQQAAEAEIDDVEALIREGEDDYEEDFEERDADAEQQPAADDARPAAEASKQQHAVPSSDAGNGNKASMHAAQGVQQPGKSRIKSAIQWTEPALANGSHESTKQLSAQEARRLRFGGDASTAAADRAQDKSSDKGRDTTRGSGDRDRGRERDRERELAQPRRSRTRSRSPPRDFFDRPRDRDMHRGPHLDRDGRLLQPNDWDRRHPHPHPWGPHPEGMRARDRHGWGDEWGPERDAYSRDRGRPHDRPGPWGPERLPPPGYPAAYSPGREPPILEAPAAALPSPRQRLRSVVSGSLEAGEGAGKVVGEEGERHVDRVDRAAGAGRILGQTLVKTLVDHGGSSIFARLSRRPQPGDTAGEAGSAPPAASQRRPSVFERLSKGLMGSKRHVDEEPEQGPAAYSPEQEPQQEEGRAHNPTKLRRTEGSQSIGSALVSAASAGERGATPATAAAAALNKPGSQRQASIVTGAIQAARLHHAKQVQKQQPAAGAAATLSTAAAAAPPTPATAVAASHTAAGQKAPASKPDAQSAQAAAGTAAAAAAPPKVKSELDELREHLKRKEMEIARMKNNLNMQQMMPSILQPQAAPSTANAAAAAAAAAAQQAAARRAEAAAAQQADMVKRADADRRSVVVHNLPPAAATTEALMQYFGRCGQITRITILRDPHTNAPRGSAYIEFAEIASKQAACGLTGSHFLDQVIRVLPKPVALTSSTPRTTPQLGGGTLLAAPGAASAWPGAGSTAAMAAQQMQGVSNVQGQVVRLADAPPLQRPMVWRRPGVGDSNPAGTQAQA